MSVMCNYWAIIMKRHRHWYTAVYSASVERGRCECRSELVDDVYDLQNMGG